MIRVLLVVAIAILTLAILIGEYQGLPLVVQNVQINASAGKVN